TAAGVANNIYTQIGLVLLIALSSKNAILIVEFARELRLKEGKSIEEAAVEASRVRFRPIVMTSIAFILGVAPLVVATGAGAAAVHRHHRLQRHAGLDLHRHPVRAGAVHRAAALVGTPAAGGGDREGEGLTAILFPSPTSGRAGMGFFLRGTRPRFAWPPSPK